MIYNITFSPTSGTMRVTKYLLHDFSENVKNISLLPAATDYASYTFQPEDICMIAVPSFGGRVPTPAVSRLSKMHGNFAKAILVCVYGNRAYEDTLLELKETVKAAGFHPIAAVSAVAEHSIMRQFAAGRPDQEDISNLLRFSSLIYTRLQSNQELDEVSVPGNMPYRQYGGVPFKPQATSDCNGCGICAEECPVSAIVPSNIQSVDSEICISCMRCIAVCPQKARILDPALLQDAASNMKKLFEERKVNEVFINEK